PSAGVALRHGARPRIASNGCAGRRPAARAAGKNPRGAGAALSRRAVEPRAPARRRAAREPYRGRSARPFSTRDRAVPAQPDRGLARVCLCEPPAGGSGSGRARGGLSQPMRARVIVPLAVLLLAGLGAAWFFSAFERVPAKEQVGP